MDPKIKEYWVEALRSGKYKQGSGRLLRRDRGTERYCCLGVLADVCGLDPHKVGSEQILNGETAEKLGVGEHQGRLATKNDSGATFDQIADYIEENL